MESPDGNTRAVENFEAHTYHCLCSELVLSSSHMISHYARRSGDGLDKAHIMPLLHPLDESKSDENVHQQESEVREGASTLANPSDGVALLLNTSLDRKPIVVRREDGFEKRYMQRCSRCRLIVGYQLDKSQYDDYTVFGRREDVVYILPGAVMSTEEMSEGKEMASSIGFKALGDISEKE